MSAENRNNPNNYVAANGCPDASGCWILKILAIKYGVGEIKSKTPIAISCGKPTYILCARVQGGLFHNITISPGFPGPISYEETLITNPSSNRDFEE